jgi:outer membrane protein assembly factor BamB
MRLAPYTLGERVLSLTRPLTSGTDIRHLQQQLKTLGLLETLVDGVFGPATKRAVIRFQRKAGLKVTGQVDPRTAELISRLAQNPHWTHVGGNPAHTGQGMAPIKPPPKMLWKKPVAAPAKLFTTRDMLVAKFPKVIAVYDKTTAARRWIHKLPNYAFIATDSSRIFIIDEAKALVRSQTGKQKFSIQTEEPCTHSPLITHGRLILPSQRRLFCFDTIDGSQNWVFRSRAPFWAPSAEKLGTVVQPCGFKTVMALDIKSGHPIWIKRLLESSECFPVMDENSVFIKAGSRRIYKLRLSDGEIIWETKADAKINHIALFGSYVVFIDDNNLAAFLNQDGITESEIPLDAPPTCPPVFSPGFTWLGFDDGLKVYDRSGREVWQGLKGKSINDVIIDGFNVYVSTQDYIYSFTQSP